MHLPSFSTIAVIALAALVAFGSITNALLLLFRTLGLTRAANLTAQIGGFAATAVHIVTDLREHPDAQGAKAALDELDELAEQQPTVARPITVATSKARAFLRLLGIGAAILLMALLAAGCTATQAKTNTKTVLDVSAAACKELDTKEQDLPDWVKFSCQGIEGGDQISHIFLVKKSDTVAVFSMKKCVAPSEGGVSP